jgi:hypothetical protein
MYSYSRWSAFTVAAPGKWAPLGGEGRLAPSDWEGWPMNLREKALYHQIHPAKLATDILTEPVSLYFFWRHDLWLGLATHFAPPIVASAALMTWADLAPLKASPFGRYVERRMTRPVEAARLVGDLVMVVGAWERAGWLIGVGVALVIAAWSSGRALDAFGARP